MMSQQEYAIPRGSTVLITGANGYIASHVVDLLLELGFKVRGTVRSEKRWLDRFFEEKHGKGKFESVVVPRIDDEGAYDEVIKGVTGIVHVASDVSFSADANTVIPSVIKYNLIALNAAAQEKSVKRFVLITSSTAAVIPRPNNAGVVVEENTYNDSIVEVARSDATPMEMRPFAVYAASKVEGEKAAWKWVQTKQPGFVLNTVLPSFNSGKILCPEMHGSTMGFARKLLEGDSSVTGVLPPQYYIDVRDCARLHVAGLLDATIRNERIFGFVHEFNWTDAIALFRRLRPDNKKIPDAPANEWRDESDVKPRHRAAEILRSFWGKEWTGFEESFAAGIEGAE